jgi:hypothetical protein
MKSKRKISVRAKIGEDWRSITIDPLEELTDDERQIGQVISDTETIGKLNTKEIIKLQVENDEMKSEIKLLQNGIKELVNLMKVGK